MSTHRYCWGAIPCTVQDEIPTVSGIGLRLVCIVKRLYCGHSHPAGFLTDFLLGLTPFFCNLIDQIWFDGLHGYLIQWLEFVPAEMRVILFIISQEMRGHLETEVLNGIALPLLRLR